jgi:hypothetical protein
MHPDTAIEDEELPNKGVELTASSRSARLA